MDTDYTLMSNSELKLEMMHAENEYKAIQANIRKEAVQLQELDRRYLRIKEELGKRGYKDTAR